MIFQKIVILVANTLGCGPQPDSFRYHENFHVNTLGHFADEVGGIRIPNLSQLGLGNITYIRGAEKPNLPWAYYGKIRSRTDGKDIASGFLELAGINLQKPFRVFEEEIPESVSDTFREFLGTELQILHVTSLAEVMKNLERLNAKEPLLPILFTEKNESTLELAIHVNDIAKTNRKEKEILEFMKENISAHKIAQGVLHIMDGGSESFRLIPDKRKDVFFEILDQNTVFQTLELKRIPVYAYGNIGKIYNYAGFAEDYQISDPVELMNYLSDEIRDAATDPDGKAVFVANIMNMDLCHYYNHNLYDYVKMLEKMDSQIPKILRNINDFDWVFITGVHGCDLLQENAHTREYSPLLIYNKTFKNAEKKNMGVRKTFSDIAESISEAYGLETHYGGEAFWNLMSKI